MSMRTCTLSGTRLMNRIAPLIELGSTGPQTTASMDPWKGFSSVANTQRNRCNNLHDHSIYATEKCWHVFGWRSEEETDLSISLCMISPKGTCFQNISQGWYNFKWSSLENVIILIIWLFLKHESNKVKEYHMSWSSSSTKESGTKVYEQTLYTLRWSTLTVRGSSLTCIRQVP